MAIQRTTNLYTTWATIGLLTVKHKKLARLLEQKEFVTINKATKIPVHLRLQLCRQLTNFIYNFILLQ